jgi:chromatin remodeling complex protein RSC6
MAKTTKNSKFMKPMNVTPELAAVVGDGPMPRTEVTKKLWAYIKKHKLQDPKNKRNILPDDRLAKVFEGKKAINMFDMTKKVNKHLS